MKIKYYSLIVMLLLPLIALKVYQDYFLSYKIDLNTLLEKKELDCESSFAIGKTVSLAKLDQYCLELLPGISTIKAKKILASRAELLEAASNTPYRKRCQLLTKIHGIGPIGAKKLCEYLHL